MPTPDARFPSGFLRCPPGLESVVSSFIARESVPSSTLDVPLESCGARLSVCPPPRFIRVPCSFWNILLVSSLFPSYMPPSTPVSVYSADSPPVSGPPHRPSPIIRPSEGYQPSGFGRPMSSSGFPTQRPICRFAPPTDLCGWWYLTWVWVEGQRRQLPPQWS